MILKQVDLDDMSEGGGVDCHGICFNLGKCVETCEKITGAMARDWRGPPLTVRCVEHHVYTEGGGLVMEDHRDLGSSLSLSVLLSDQYKGGAFTTTSEAGVVLTHAPKVGDGVLFASETVHNVSTVESGERRALAVEPWTGPAATHDRSK